MSRAGPTIGVRSVRHARSITFQMADLVVPRDRFKAILDRNMKTCEDHSWAEQNDR